MSSFRALIRLACIVALAMPWMSSAVAQQTDLSDVPMVVHNTVVPNVLAVMDNSESMDAYMAGVLITGNDPNTRGNIGRRVLSDIITTYRSNFNWGLMSFQLNDLALYNTYVYYFGDDSNMIFTEDCTNIDPVSGSGTSASNGGLGCIANPQPFTGGDFLTYGKSSDDPSILDVLYIGANFSAVWGTNGNGSCSDWYFNHNPVASWDPSQFSSYWFTACLTPTDAGFIITNPPYKYQVYAPRGYGFYGDISGGGQLLAPVQADDPLNPPYPAIMAALGQEQINTYTADLKNAAVFTPLKGTLISALNYYEGGSSPIQHTCQRNFVMIVTDGTPTGDENGNLYSNQDRVNTYDGVNWNFGPASQAAIDAVTHLRSATLLSNPYDIQTYVIGLGDTVQNASAVATLNAMAAAGGTTSAYLAQNEAQLLKSIDGVAQDIISKNGAASAVTVSNPNIVAGDNASYTSTYNSGTWTGDLESYPVNLTTGVIDTSSPNWPSGAQSQLDNMTPTGRMIVTYSGSQGVQFRASTDSTATTTLTSAQDAIFNSPVTPPGPADAATVIAYLRGDRTNEGTLYRTRVHLLGDLVDAEPLLVRAPSQHYADSCYSLPAPGCPTSFVTTQKNRPRVVFQGSNDGMLHAFSAVNGAELWAYVPQLVWSSMNLETRLNGFYHVYRVDGTPVSGDVDFSNTYGASGVPDWHTMVIGGLGKGGRGYYALDVTNPVPTDEPDAATHVMWEFPNPTTNAAIAVNQGDSYGRPVLTKTAGLGWVVLVTSGYNNGSTVGGDGQGHLFVLNARNGALIRDIATGVGSPGSPSGLAKVSAYAANGSVNNTTDYVYGGDLRGNVWRFDLTATDPAQWNVTKLAALVDASGTPQPVTSEPQLAEITKGGVSRRFVYVGTGQYLGDSDVFTTQTQTMYGLIDDLSTTPLITPLRASLQQQTITPVGNAPTERQLTSNAINYSSQRGWYVDFNLSPGERINTDPQLAVNALVLTTNIPSSDVCVPGGSSWFYTIDYENGGLLQNTTQPLYSGLYLGNALASRPSLVQLPNGTIEAAIHLSDGSSPSENVPVPASITGGRRVFWQEVINN